MAYFRGGFRVKEAHAMIDENDPGFERIFQRTDAGSGCMKEQPESKTFVAVKPRKLTPT
jgi:hypothetical protein